MTLQPVKTAIIGCGNISSIYLQNCPTWEILDVVACADLDFQRAARTPQNSTFCAPSLSTSCWPTRSRADPEPDHPCRARRRSALAAAGGRQIGLQREAAGVDRRARTRSCSSWRGAQGLRVGCAPDTFLGGGSRPAAS